MVVPEQWVGQPFQDKSADLWVVMLSDHNEKYSDRMERSYKAFAVTFELKLPFPLTYWDLVMDMYVTELGHHWIRYHNGLLSHLLLVDVMVILKSIISEHIFRIKFMSTFCEIAHRWMPQKTFDDKSTLVQVMAWCLQAPSHHLSQC